MAETTLRAVFGDVSSTETVSVVISARSGLPEASQAVWITSIGVQESLKR